MDTLKISDLHKLLTPLTDLDESWPRGA